MAALLRGTDGSRIGESGGRRTWVGRWEGGRRDIKRWSEGLRRLWFRGFKGMSRQSSRSWQVCLKLREMHFVPDHLLPSPELPVITHLYRTLSLKNRQKRRAPKSFYVGSRMGHGWGGGRVGDPWAMQQWLQPKRYQRVVTSNSWKSLTTLYKCMSCHGHDTWFVRAFTEGGASCTYHISGASFPSTICLSDPHSQSRLTILLSIGISILRNLAASSSSSSP